MTDKTLGFDNIGERLLIQEVHGVQLEEVDVIEFSPSGERVKLRWAHNYYAWRHTDDYEIVEKLPPRPAPPIQANGGISPPPLPEKGMRP